MRVLLSRSRPDHSDDRGAVAILVAVLLLVLVGSAAFAVDLGSSWATKRKLSVSADAAALAAAGRLAELSGTSCNANQTIATQVATSTIEQQSATAVRDITVTASCDPSGAYGEVTVRITEDVDALFGKVLGASTYEPTREATARYGPAQTASGLRPWTVCIDDVYLNGAVRVGETVLVPFQNFVGKCGTVAPGNWGLTDFDGKQNPNGDIADWTRNGYPGQVCLGSTCVPTPADPGNNAANASEVLDALDTLVDNRQVVQFPVATQYVDKGGNTADFATAGVVSGEVCGYYFAKNKQNTGPCWDDAAEAAALAQDSKAQFLQIRITRATTSYVGSGTACAGGFGSSCDFGVRFIQLYR